jgi:hypothetical protein
MIKRNLGLIVKLYVNHIALAIYGLLMAIIGNFIGEKSMNGNHTISYVFGVIAVIVYLGILYVNFWELGASDKIKIDGGRLQYNMYTGLLISLVANIPTILFALLGFLSRFISGEFFEFSRIICHYYNGMYISFLGPLSGFAPIYLIIILPALITGMVSYILGAKGYKCLFPEPKKKQQQNIE